MNAILRPKCYTSYICPGPVSTEWGAVTTAASLVNILQEVDRVALKSDSEAASAKLIIGPVWIWIVGHLHGANQTARPSEGIGEIWVLASTISIWTLWKSDLPSLGMGFHKCEKGEKYSLLFYIENWAVERGMNLAFTEHVLGARSCAVCLYKWSYLVLKWLHEGAAVRLLSGWQHWCERWSA